MSRTLLIFVTALAAFAADDPWAKVKDLKGGTELRVWKKGSAQPISAKMDELTDENLVVVVKSEQVAIKKDLIDRVDYRPAGGSRMTVDSKTKTTDPDTRPAPPGYGSRTPGTTSSSGISFGSKPDFETAYKRPLTAPKK